MYPNSILQINLLSRLLFFHDSSTIYNLQDKLSDNCVFLESRTKIKFRCHAIERLDCAPSNPYNINIESCAKTTTRNISFRSILSIKSSFSKHLNSHTAPKQPGLFENIHTIHIHPSIINPSYCISQEFDFA